MGAQGRISPQGRAARDTTPSPRRTSRRAAGGSGCMVLIWVTTVLAVVGIFAVWANRQMLSPTNWSNTSTKLLQNADIREATSNYLVDQLYANVNVEAGNQGQAALPAAAARRSDSGRPCATWQPKRPSGRSPTREVQEVWKKANYRGRPDVRDDRQRRKGGGPDQGRAKSRLTSPRSWPTSPTGSACRTSARNCRRRWPS